MQGWLLHSVSAPECLPPARQHSSCRVKAVMMTAMAPACMEPPLRRERHQTGELSKRKGPCRLRQVGGFTGEGEKVLVGRGARWPSRACSCEPPHARCEDLGFLSPQVAKGSRLSGKSDACLQPGLPGEWHVWGADLSFTLQSALWNVLGLPPVSCTWWAGRQACGQSLQDSWEGRGRDEKAKVASGDCNREDEGQRGCPSTKDTADAPTPGVTACNVQTSTYLKGTGWCFCLGLLASSIPDTLWQPGPTPISTLLRVQHGLCWQVTQAL